MADDWFSYVVTPAMYREALGTIEAAAGTAQRVNEYNAHWRPGIQGN